MSNKTLFLCNSVYLFGTWPLFGMYVIVHFYIPVLYSDSIQVINFITILNDFRSNFPNYVDIDRFWVIDFLNGDCLKL